MSEEKHTATRDIILDFRNLEERVEKLEEVLRELLDYLKRESNN